MQRPSVKFWGVRGSMAVGSSRTATIGGDTSCVELRIADQVIILDAGTGIRSLGNFVMREFARGRKSYSATIILSHMHWDHFIGLPFFKPLYDNRSLIRLLGSKNTAKSFKKLINEAISPPYFPITIKNMVGISNICQISTKKFNLGRVLVSPFPTNHPDGALGFRFDYQGNSIAYVSDNEPSTHNEFLRTVQCLNDCKILIHDAQYTSKIYGKKIGWGHSPYTYPIDLAVRANVGRLILFHFDPDSSDLDVLNLAKAARAYARKKSRSLKIILARQGLSVSI